jgi:deazaflavin-dependent oxidoreductase (nitroreductase family)
MAETKPPAALPAWIADHLKRYLATDGADGHIWNGVPTLLLTTTGRKSGRPQQLPLIYGRDGASYVIVASRGGAPDHPGWYKNLVAHPDVKLQVAAERFAARARTAKGPERTRLWDAMAKVFAPYNDYQKKTTREIPVVVLERA